MSVLDGQSSSNSEPHLVGKITGAERQLSRSPDLNVRSHDAVSLNVFAVFQAQNPIETTPLPLPFLSLFFPPSAPALKWTIARDLIPTVHRDSTEHRELENVVFWKFRARHANLIEGLTSGWRILRRKFISWFSRLPTAN